MALPAALSRFPASRPLLFLSASFALYKSLLLLIAAGTLALRDYDTSTDLFLALANNGSAPGLASKLLRWDAVYFTHVAREGYVFEQEWAFGTGFSSAVRWAARLARAAGLEATELAAGIAIAHGAHLAAVLLLYRLTLGVASVVRPAAGSSLDDETRTLRRRRAVVPALLHILSPAGIFLSAPYAESSFAALSFLGILLFAHAARRPTASLARSAALVLAGVAFGASATFRSNGLLSGLPFLVEAVTGAAAWWTEGRHLLSRRIVDVGAVCIGGLCVAVGFVGPQAVAWMRYCAAGQGGGMPRAWCRDMPPSIYSHVQSAYWNVGFLRYWTPNQIPLFLLAGPMLALLVSSGLSALRAPASCLAWPLSAAAAAAKAKTKTSKPPARGKGQLAASPPTTVTTTTTTTTTQETTDRAVRLVRTLAAAQVLLAVLAFTSYHVQIVNRISSGYPVWYWWVGACFADVGQASRRIARSVVVVSVVYGALQAVLFASFMPPA